MDAETIFYLILFIIYIASSLVGGSKKKKKQAPPPDYQYEGEYELEGEYDNNAPTIEQMLEEYLGGGKPKKQPQQAPVQETSEPVILTAEDVAHELDEDAIGRRADRVPLETKKQSVQIQRDIDTETGKTITTSEQIRKEYKPIAYKSLAEQQLKDRGVKRESNLDRLRRESEEKKAKQKQRRAKRKKQKQENALLGDGFNFNLRDAVIYNIVMERRRGKKKF